MECKVSFENKTFSDEKQAANELAFCHYPVEVTAGDEKEVFCSFDDARRFVGQVFAAGRSFASDDGE